MYFLFMMPTSRHYLPLPITLWCDCWTVICELLVSTRKMWILVRYWSIEAEGHPNPKSARDPALELNCN